MSYDDCTIVEIVAGRHGLWGVRNSKLVPIGGLVQFRNATLEDNTWRTGGGAKSLGVAVGARARAGFDYAPALGVQRTLGAYADGTIRKDDGDGAGHVSLVAGLTIGGSVPHFTTGGEESAGRARKVFYADGLNAPLVLPGDGVAMAALATPNVDWAGTNQPRFFAVDQLGYNWAGGNKNSPHAAYRSKQSDHEDFNGTPFRLIIGPGYREEHLVIGLPYKGGMLFWKYPEGVYFVDQRDTDPANWFPQRVATPGLAGPRCVTSIEDDVVWVSPDGSWHLINATNAQGSVTASDIAHRKLGDFAIQQMNLDELANADLVYDSFKREVLLAHAPKGQTDKSRRLHLDLHDQLAPGGSVSQGGAENWLLWDRDRNEALFMRREGKFDRPAMLDETGTLWQLDRANRNKDGSGYTFEWFMRDTDFAQLLPSVQGRKMNLRFIKLVFDPRSAATHTVEFWADGRKRKTIDFNLEGGGIVLDDPVLAALDTAVFGSETLRPTHPRRLGGQAYRVAFRGYTSAPDKDVSIAGIIIGLTRAA